MSVYRELVAVSVPVRRAAALTGVSRASASYRPRSATGAAGESVRSVPVNKLTADERQQVLGMLDSEQFIDLAQLQIYGRLLDSGVYVLRIHVLPGVEREPASQRTTAFSHSPATGTPRACRNRTGSAVLVGYHQARWAGERTLLRRVRDD